jgi:hypothetical protein
MWVGCRIEMECASIGVVILGKMDGTVEFFASQREMWVGCRTEMECSIVDECWDW